MTWYKFSKLETFLDRNRINARIRLFKDWATKLKYLQKYIFQNAPDAKRFIETLSETKEMSSFPKLKQKMQLAAYKALDNYKEFAVICRECMDDIVKLVTEMENERNNFKKDIPKNDRKN